MKKTAPNEHEYGLIFALVSKKMVRAYRSVARMYIVLMKINIPRLKDSMYKNLFDHLSVHFITKQNSASYYTKHGCSTFQIK